MKIKELIEHLKTFPQDSDILMAGDNEGNSFHHTSNGFAKTDKGIVMYPEHLWLDI